MSKVKVAETWIGACAGCEISVLDTHEALLPILDKIEFVYIPVLMDTKHIPKATVGIVSGCVRNSDNLHELLEMRKNVDILVALGSCACFGGTPGMANLYTPEQLLEEVYVTTKSTKNEIQRHPYMDGLPTLLPDAKPLSDYVKVDAMIPGCGPRPAMIAQAILSLLGAAEYKLSTKSVCDECAREKSERNLKKILRPFEGTIDEKKCLFEQGYLCSGSATRAGCGAMCPSSGVACRGCFGPCENSPEQGSAMISAVSSCYGLDDDPNTDLDKFVAEVYDPIGNFYKYTMPSSFLTKKAVEKTAKK
ncbi:NADH-quinone oxidoreductase subunit B family protein [Methanocella arvoryzae]|uniref:Coenzyme F420-non-reducing hydrogenase (Methyl viologen-reducing hydrogenase), gamma subunit n=1 Tax=Methanocella arvoryzae (strain DSM 22066 / NBRC 105507 / MRE50) TaxID=351160 RepID=Q0W6J6_METAR|nr:hydrogenase [Methanocella arvoryzae]CAJ35997.1 coenzyme F420-non-reducing hydrogenase (methyl viologen-reducing hydrogenase), gamma subunit [Methanocella arvoryzae MRE50]